MQEEDDFPANSHKQAKDYTAKPEKVQAPGVEPKKIEKVVEGTVLRRKKPWTRRFLDSFVGGDMQTVRSYIVMEVLLPAAKDTVADVFSQGIERMLYGEARSTSRRTGHRPGQGVGPGYVNYSRYTPNPVRPGRRDELRSPTHRARATHDFDEIILATRVEAEEVIDRLFDLVSRYEQATVADLYELVGVTGNYTDDKWGWTDLRGAGVTRVRNGYLLDLQRPEPLV